MLNIDELKFDNHGLIPAIVVDAVSKRVLTLPLYADLPMESVDRICDLVLSCRK